MDVPGRSSLGGLLTSAFQLRRHRRALYVAQDLADLLGELVPRSIATASPKPACQTFGLIAGIDIIVPPEAPPGTFRLIEHNACQAHDDKPPTHERCEVVIEGRVDITASRRRP